MSSLIFWTLVTTVVARQHFAIPEQNVAQYFGSGSVHAFSAPLSTDPVAIAQAHVRELVPGSEFRDNGDSYTDTNGISHVFFTQTLNSLDIINAQANVNIKSDGSILSSGSSFIKGKLSAPSVGRREAMVDAVGALKGTVRSLGLPISVDNAQAVPKSDGSRDSFVFTGTEGTLSQPTANLAYYASPNGIKLVWKLETDTGDNWLVSYADALQEGEVVGAVDYVADASYRVYKFGVVSDPTQGSRTLEVDPANVDENASPVGWHQAGTTSFTTTRGNNVIAQENFDAGSDFLNNGRPNAGSSLVFDYPYSLTATNQATNINASVTQLFYTVNKYHDLALTLGFTEPAGNFEDVNTLGGRGNDAAQTNAQDGAGLNNADFATPPDGQRPRMRMFLWNAAGGAERDGAFDQSIVLHEYTHGISNRLTGGPATTSCLNGGESGGMGEGRGDFMGTAIGLKPTDTRDTDKPLATWAAGEGIRLFPYSTSMTTNPTIYSTLNTAAFQVVHASGSVWAEMLFEVLWNLEDKHGYSADPFPAFRAGTQIPVNGRQLAMKLVVMGMSLQPCNPTFLSARDAIIDADTTLTGGENLCELWTGFAKRGLGSNASQGTGTNRRVDGFAVPSGVC